MPRNLRRLDVKACQFPVSSRLLQDLREHRLSLRGSRIEECHCIFSGRQIVQIERRTVRCLPVLAEHATIKLRLRNWRRSRCIQQKRFRDRALPSRKDLLIVLYRAFDSGEVGGKTWNRILLQRRGISRSSQSEVPLRGGCDGIASRLVDLVAQLAILRIGAHGRIGKCDCDSPKGECPDTAWRQLHRDSAFTFRKMEAKGQFTPAPYSA